MAKRPHPCVAALAHALLFSVLPACSPDGDHTSLASAGEDTPTASAPDEAAPRTTAAKPLPDPAPRASASPPPDRAWWANTPPTDPREVLEKMIAAYQQAETYADQGSIRVEYRDGHGQNVMDVRDFSVTFTRPNRIRMACYQANVVCDGQRFVATIEECDKQVLTREAPAQLTLEFLMEDELLGMVLAQGIGGIPPQVRLLLTNDPLGELLRGAERLALVGSESIDGHLCDGVQAWKDGIGYVFWVDRHEHTLRRLEYPVAHGTGIQRVVAEFAGARCNRSVPDIAFQFSAPENARLVRRFVLPPVPPPERLGRKVDEFRFTSYSGESLSQDALRDKIAVLEFWIVGSGVGGNRLARWKEFEELFRDEERVAWAAVNVDDPSLPEEVLAERLEEWGVRLPYLRDPDQQAVRVFGCDFFPQFVLLSADGRIQAREAPPTSVRGGEAFEQVPDLVRRLLQGEDLAEARLAAHAKQQREYDEELVRASSENSTATEDVPTTTIRARSSPAIVRMDPLWSCTEVASPGNLLVLQGPGGAARIFVVEAARRVAELDQDGRHAGSHMLGLPEGHLVTFLRHTAAGDGEGLIVAFASMQPQVHVFTTDFQRKFSYPPSPEASVEVADARFLPLGEDGATQLVVGFWGALGVHGVDLQGRRAWLNETAGDIAQVVPGPAIGGKPTALCASGRGALFPVDGAGKSLPDMHVENHILFHLHAHSAETGSDLAPDQYCGWTISSSRNLTAVGFDGQGQARWSHELPAGRHPTPVEPVAVGGATALGNWHWFLAAPDGSIHIIGSDGALLDQFAYGKEIRGLAVCDDGAMTRLIVSTPGGVEAWRLTRR